MSTEEFDSATLEKKLRQVQAMLDRAEHPNTPPGEAATARAMAEQMMRKYQIEEENLRQTALAQGKSTMVPVKDEFPICDYNSQYRSQYTSLFFAIVHHVGNVRAAYKYDNGQQMAYLIGFESDVRYTETLYTALRLHFANTLEPQYDPSLSEKENVYRLRSAGIERHLIARMIWGSGKKHLEVGRLYKEACADRGESAVASGRGTNVKTYRKSFAEGYVAQVNNRLWQMQSSAGIDSMALELAGRKDAVDEAFYEQFPHLRPITREDRMLGESDITGGPFGNCPKCKKAKSGYCRDHNFLRPTTRRESRSYAGIDAGRRAANSADLGGRTGTGRIEP